MVHGLRRARPSLGLVIYGEEDNRTVGQALAAELRAQGFSVSALRLGPASGRASYDSAAALVARQGTALFAVADRPVAGRGTIGVPPPLLALLGAAARIRPTVLLSLGNPYLISRVPEIGSYLIAWLTGEFPRGWVAAIVWGVIAVPVLVVAGWREPTRMKRVSYT